MYEFFPLWCLDTVHVRAMSTFCTLTAERSWKPILWLQISGPGGPSQTPSANLTNNMKNKTPSPYLQWNLSHSLLPPQDNKWSEWYIHQDHINCEIKRSVFESTLPIQGRSSQEALICLFNEMNHLIVKLFRWDIMCQQRRGKITEWIVNLKLVTKAAVIMINHRENLNKASSGICY